MAGQVGSGYLDPTRQDLDPTRPAVIVNLSDPPRPNPTRPAGPPDPETTLGTTLKYSGERGIELGTA